MKKEGRRMIKEKIKLCKLLHNRGNIGTRVHEKQILTYCRRGHFIVGGGGLSFLDRNIDPSTIFLNFSRLLAGIRHKILKKHIATMIYNMYISTF
jgi:hypothetical protein